MRNLGTLYRYELKKIFQKKLTWIAMGAVLLICVCSACFELVGSYYVNGVFMDTQYSMLKKDQAYARALSGRKMDQKLLEELQAAYGMLEADAADYSATKEYQIYARPYSAVFQVFRQASGMSEEMLADWDADEAAFYQARQQRMETSWSDYMLTQEEKRFWTEKEAKIEKPFVFEYRKGYTKLAELAYTVNLLVLLLNGICLSGVFADEHARRTDQLLLSGKLGKKELYRAKMLAGMSFGAGSALLYSAVTALCVLAVYGADGFHAAVQLSMPNFSGKLSMGEAVLIQYGLLFTASVLTSVFVLMLSELLHNSIGTLGLLFGILLLPMFVSIPEQYRIASQLFSYLPGELVSVWNTFNVRLVKGFGTFFTAWQAAPVLYLLLGTAFALAGGYAYRRYQVSGR